MSKAASLLPVNATAFEQSLAAPADRVLDIDADIVRRVTVADECPPDQLPALAWEYSVDEWSPAWSDERKRAVIRASLEVHQKKGTAFGLRVGIAAVGQDVQIEEWFEYSGQPYRFRLVIDLEPDEIFKRKDTELIARVALRSKNVRSLLEYILFRRTRTWATHVGGAIHSRLTRTIGPFVADLIVARPYAHIGAGLSAKTVTTIYPGA
ncbi:phage tail protein I [Sulfitobacter sp. OXR-159]|uniref:phage tail protein I n=1 Tax=Sulfitobacter sp. OXR-159 TaxID=3100174 RepID=UPI002AC99E4E|nr:phage tail protein I [Sulfitobacter sp. OXR-159]WPZ28974.1 phage tail protein I [Sulfitobacter sp. OXR-159]